MTYSTKKHKLAISASMIPAVLTLLLLPTFAQNAAPGKPFPGDSRFFQVGKPSGNGLLDANGKEIIPCKYGYMEYVGEDRFIINEAHGKKKSLWNTDGKRVCSIPEWTSMHGTNQFSDRLLLLSGNSLNNEVVYIDKTGKHIVKENTYRTGQPFRNGLAAVTYERREGEYLAYIDTSGKIKLGPFFGATGSSFYSRFASLRTATGKFGMIDKTGQFVLKPEYDHLQWEGDDKCILKKGDRTFTANCTDSGITIHENESPLNSAPIQPKSNDDNELKWTKVRFISANDLLISKRRAPLGQSFHAHRRKIFFRFLDNFDVIGMERQLLEERLGKSVNEEWLSELPSGSSSMVRYSLSPGAPCGFGSSSLEIAFDSRDKVTGWRIVQGHELGRWSWNCDNVVALDYDLPPIFNNLIPKEERAKYKELRKEAYDN